MDYSLCCRPDSLCFDCQAQTVVQGAGAHRPGQ